MRSEQNKSANIEKKNVLTVVAIFQVVQRLEVAPLVLDGGEDAAAADAGVQGVVRLQCATVVIEEVEDRHGINNTTMQDHMLLLGTRGHRKVNS